MMAWNENPANYQNIHSLTAPLIEFAQPEQNDITPLNQPPNLDTSTPPPPKKKKQNKKQIKTKPNKITKTKKKILPSNDLTLDNFV